MTIASLNARLRRCDPHLRIRKRTGWIMPYKQGFAVAGVYRNTTYKKVTMLAGDLPYRTRPIIMRIERFPGQKESQARKFIIAYPRRGRRPVVSVLKAMRVLKHRWQYQLLAL